MNPDSPRPTVSAPVRWLLIAAGSIALMLGIVGIFMPLLPTTPFVLLAAACYARASPRLHERLLASRTFGPMILEWETHRSIPYQTKIMAIVLMSATLAASIIFFVKQPWLKGVLAILGVVLAVWLYRIPSRDRPQR